MNDEPTKLKPFLPSPKITQEMIADAQGRSICPRCKKMFRTKRGMWSHVKQVHKDWPSVEEILGRKPTIIKEDGAK
jgi:uncharacterized C2H2 Zn-finger protein